MGQDEKHVRFADEPEVRTYVKGSPPNSLSAPAPQTPAVDTPADVASPPKHTPPNRPLPPIPGDRSPADAATPQQATPAAGLSAPAASQKPPERVGRREDGPQLDEMPRDPSKLAAWLEANKDKLPADERAALEERGRAQAGPPTQVRGDDRKLDLSSDEASALSKKPMFSGLGDRISKFATEMKDKIKSTFSRDDSPAAPQQAQGPAAPGRSPAQMGAPGDPAKYAEWLQNNQQLLSPQEKGLMQQVAAQNKAPSMVDAPRDPAQYAEWLQKNPQLLSPKEKDLVNHIAGQGSAPSMADAPRDPAQYAQWLQKNPQLLSPQEQSLVAHVQGANEPGAHPAPGATEPASPSAPVPGASPSDAKAPETPAPHTAHPLYTPEQAHEVAREIAQEHQHGHAIERGGH